MPTPSDLLHDIVCASVKHQPAKNGAQKITTPFLDWKGAAVEIFVRPTGEVTDGGRYVNELRALRVYSDFEVWPFRFDFMSRYAIEEREGALVCADPQDPEALLSYVQGIARLGGYFEPKVPRDTDNFPRDVQDTVRPKLDQYIPPLVVDRERWKTQRFSPRKVTLRDGAVVETDLDPIDQRLMIQVVSRSNASGTEKRQHVGAKILPFEMSRNRNHRATFVVVIPDLRLYPEDAQNLLRHSEAKILEWRKEATDDVVAKLLGSHSGSEIAANL